MHLPSNLRRLAVAVVGVAALVATLPSAPAGATVLGPDTIVFNSNATGTASESYEIFRMESDGTGRTRLTFDTQYDSWWPKPSPDRTKIMFVRSPAGIHDSDPQQFSVWMMNADGSDVHAILPRGVHGWSSMGHPEWSPDGTKLTIYAAGQNPSEPQVWIVDADGTDPVRVTSDGNGGLRSGANTDPVWSPDGTHLLFNGCELGQKFCTAMQLEIFRINVDGTGETRLTNNLKPDYDPYYSPDGSTIAWLQNTGLGPLNPWGIMRMDADGWNQRAVIDDGGINSKPAWSLDGQWIYFHRAVTWVPGYVFSVWKIRPDGTGLTELILPRAADFSHDHNEYPVNGV